MSRDVVMRRTLLAGAVFNLAAAAMVLFPSSLGRLADFPTSAPRLHTWILAFFVALFGATYAWLSRRPVIDRPIVVMAVIGKCGVFLVSLACLLLGDISAKTFAPGVADLAFAVVFVWWLNGPSSA